MNIFKMDHTIIRMLVDTHDEFVESMREFYTMLKNLDHDIYPGSLESFSFVTGYMDFSKQLIIMTFVIGHSFDSDEYGNVIIPLQWLFMDEERVKKIVIDNKAARLQKEKEEIEERNRKKNAEIEEHERAMLRKLLDKYEGKVK